MLGWWNRRRQSPDHGSLILGGATSSPGMVSPLGRLGMGLSKVSPQLCSGQQGESGCWPDMDRLGQGHEWKEGRDFISGRFGVLEPPLRCLGYPLQKVWAREQGQGQVQTWAQ